MGDSTYSVKLPDEIQDKVKALIEASGISSKEFMSNLITNYELYQVKNSVPLLTDNINELESLTRRINSLFIHIAERINTIEHDNADKLRQYRDENNKDIDIFKQRIKLLENELSQAQDYIKESTQIKEIADKKEKELKKRIEEVEDINEKNNSIIVEYKQRIDTMSSIVVKHEQSWKENESLTKQILVLQQQLQEKDNLQNKLEIQHEKNILALKKEYQEKEELYQDKHIDLINQYENKVKELLSKFETKTIQKESNEIKEIKKDEYAEEVVKKTRPKKKM